MTWYQPYFCEENAWQALAHNLLEMPTQWAVFISNPAKACALWAQAAAPSVGEPVFWDYHVVVMGLDERGVLWVYDPDHVPGTTCTLAAWWGATFPIMAEVRELYHPWCRVVERDAMLARFYSDRGHMLGPDGQWLKPAPSWPLLTEGDVDLSTLMDMTVATMGQVFTASQFEQRYLDKLFHDY